MRLGSKEMTDWVDANGGITIDGEQYGIEVVVYDSESDSSKCSELAQKLIEEDNVDLMIAIQTPETVIPVASTTRTLRCSLRCDPGTGEPGSCKRCRRREDRVGI